MPRLPVVGLRARFILLVVLAIVPAFGLLLYTAVEQRRLAAAEAQQEALRLARLASGDQERFVERTRALLTLLAQVPAVRGAEPGCGALLARLLAENPLYVNLGATNLNGDPICSGLPITGALNFADRTWFQRAVATRAFAVGDHQISRVAGKAVLPFGYPILDEAGQIRVLLYAALDLSWINQVAADAQLPAGWALTVADQNGTVIARHPDPEKWVGKSAPEVPILRRAAARQGEGTALATDADGVPRLYVFTLLRGTPTGGIFVIVGVPRDAAFADADRILSRNLLAFGIACLLALAATWMGTDLFILRRVRALVTATNRVAAGDLSARTEVRYGIGELSHLSRAFDRMAESLETRQREARRAQDALRQSEKRYREVVENGLGLICTHDLDGTLLSMNAPAAHRLGYQPAELIGRNMREFIVPWARHLFDEYLRRIRQEPAIGGLMRVVTKAGEERVWMYRNRRIEEDRTRPYVIGHAQDITERRRAEQALRESERKLQAQYEELEQLYKTAPVGLCLVDREMRFVRINERLAAIDGKPVEDHIGRRPRDVIPGIAAEVELIFRRVVDSGEPVLDLEMHGMTPAEPGVERDWLASYYPVKSDDGAVHGVSAVVLEITERKQAEETLRQSEERFRALAEAAPIGIFLTKPTGECIYTNPRWSAISGLSSEESLGYGWTRAIHPDDRETVKESWLTAVARGENYATDYRVVTPAGDLRWVHALATPQVDASESVVNYIGSVEDVTDRKRAEEELKTRARQQAAVAQLGAVAAAANLQTLMVEATALLARTLDVEYAKVLELLPEGNALILRAGVGWRDGLVGRATLGAGTDSQAGYTLQSGGPVIVEDLRSETRFTGPPLLREHGVVSSLSVTIPGQDRPFGVLGAHTTGRRIFTGDDIHFLQAIANVLAEAIARTRAEEALRRTEKLAAMGELLAGVAHELNNPLAVIVGQTELLRQTVAHGPVADRTEKIARAAERCARIVKNFLALAYPHAAERRRIELNPIVRQVIELFAYELGVNNVQVSSHLAPDLPPLLADPSQLQQMVVNLVTNAHQAMREASGPRRLTLVSRFDSSRGRIVFEVADTGSGIPPEIRPRIFEPFFTTKPPGRGTGLGLSLCQRIVEAHGGTIEVNSEVGHGTAFRIELPVAPALEPTVEPREPEPLPRIQGKSILVVDDEPGVAAVLVDLLFRDAHRVDTASNGLVALTKLNAGAYDLIVSDIKMPELDGSAFYREVARRYPKLSRRIIFITGDSLSPETRQFLAETGAPSLNKPFALDEVRRLIQQVLGAA